MDMENMQAEATKSNEKLKKFVVSSREEMWKDEGFLLVVNAYLVSIKKSLEFFLSVEALIVLAQDTRLILSYVFELYEREVNMEYGDQESKCSRSLDDLLWLKENRGHALGERLVKVIRSVYEKGEGKAYMRVLEEMKRTGATTVGSNPSKDDLLNLYGAAHTEQRQLRDRSEKQIRKLSKKLRWIKWGRMASKVMFGIGFFTVPVLTALVMFVPIPSSVEVLVGAFSATIGSIGKWWSYVLNKRDNSYEFQKDGLVTIEKNSFKVLMDMETLQRLVELVFHDIEFMVLVLNYMRESGKVPEGEMKDTIEKIMLQSYMTYKDVEEHSWLAHHTIVRASNLVSERLSSVTTPTSTLKRRSWMDIFM